MNKKKITHLSGRIDIEGPDKIIVSIWNKSDNRFDLRIVRVVI